MSDLLTSAAIFGGLLLLAVLVALEMYTTASRRRRQKRRRQQALAREQELREIENSPTYTFGAVFDGLPADIQKDFQR